MKIDHIGYAVKKIDKARETFEKLGYIFEEKIEDADRNIYVQFGKLDNYIIELVSPLDSNKESPVDNYIKKTGPIPYHFCYKVEDIKKSIKELETQGFKLIIPEKPAIAYEGKRVAFLLNINIGMIELVEM